MSLCDLSVTSRCLQGDVLVVFSVNFAGEPYSSSSDVFKRLAVNFRFNDQLYNFLVKHVLWYSLCFNPLPSAFSLRKTHFLPLKRFLKCYGAKCH